MCSSDLLCSLTPVADLDSVLARIGWRGYFEGVEGYPVDKAAMLRRVQARHAVGGDRILMVGDDDRDEAAARAAGTEFFRIRALDDLHALDEYLGA